MAFQNKWLQQFITFNLMIFTIASFLKNSNFHKFVKKIVRNIQVRNGEINQQFYCLIVYLQYKFKEIYKIQCFWQLSIKMVINKIDQYITMINQQAKPFHCNSSTTLTFKEKQLYASQTSASSHVKIPNIQKQDVKQGVPEKDQYSKLLKQKESRILSLSDRVKLCQRQIQMQKKINETVQNDLNFFRSKLQQQFHKNSLFQSEIEVMNKSFKNCLDKFAKLFDINTEQKEQLITSFSSQNYHNSYAQFEITQRLFKNMEDHISSIQKTHYLIKKQAKSQDFMGLQFQEYKKIDQMEKQSLRKHINNLIEFYENKILDMLDYPIQAKNLRNQRQFTNQLLLKSEKEKIVLVNQIYQIAKNELKIDFVTIDKPSLVRLCLKLFSKIKELEMDKISEQRHKQTEVKQKQKYSDMLKTVKNLSKSTNLRRLPSLTVN